MSAYKKDLLAIGFLLLLVCVLGYLGTSWASVNPLPQGRDECAHLKSAVIFQRILNESPANFVKLFAAQKEGGYHDIVYPPLQPAVTAIVKSIVPYQNDYVASVSTLYLFWAIMLVSLYMAGKTMHSRSAGMMAALLVALFPIVFDQMPVYSPYSLVAALVALSYWLLVRTNGFSKPGASALFGVGAGLAMLTYNLAALPILPPAIVYFIQALVREKEHRKSIIKGALLASIVFLAMVLPYYTSTAFWQFYEHVRQAYLGRVTALSGDFGLGNPEDFGYLTHLFYFFIILWTDHLGPVALFAFIAALGGVLWKTSGHRLALVLGCLTPLVALGFVTSKLVERTVPALPLFALVMGIGFALLPKRFIRLGLFLAFSVVLIVPLYQKYTEEKARFTREFAAGKTFAPQMETFKRIAEKGGVIDMGCGGFHTFYEYMRAMAGFRGGLHSALYHHDFYNRFDELEVVAYLSAPKDSARWFTLEELQRKTVERAAQVQVPFPTDNLEKIAGARDEFHQMACHEILDRHYCVYVRKDWWDAP